MPRYVVFLRGVSPQNCQMTRLRQALEQAGYEHVRTILSSGNAVLDASARSENALEHALEKVLQSEFGRSFFPIVRTAKFVAKLVNEDPFAQLPLATGSKRIVSFLRTEVESKIALPLSEDTATVFCRRGREIFSAYTPSPNGPVFMKLLERAFGTEITTRTLDTVAKCAGA